MWDVERCRKCSQVTWTFSYSKNQKLSYSRRPQNQTVAKSKVSLIWETAHNLKSCGVMRTYSRSRSSVHHHQNDRIYEVNKHALLHWTTGKCSVDETSICHSLGRGNIIERKDSSFLQWSGCIGEQTNLNEVFGRAIGIFSPRSGHSPSSNRYSSSPSPWKFNKYSWCLFYVCLNVNIHRMFTKCHALYRLISNIY